MKLCHKETLNTSVKTQQVVKKTKKIHHIYKNRCVNLMQDNKIKIKELTFHSKHHHCKSAISKQTCLVVQKI